MGRYLAVNIEVIVNSLSEPLLERLRALLRARLGLLVSDSFSPRVMRELEEYVAAWPGGWQNFLTTLDLGQDMALIKKLADIFTITHTYFFREPTHFDFLKEVALPELRSGEEKALRIWSAATSSGEEAYSILLTMAEYYGDHYWELDAGVLATDISKRALTKAVEGVYSTDGLRNVPTELVRKWFSPEEEGRMIIDARLRQEATFRWLNLIEPMPIFRRPFHVIFCRNVLLYFDETTRSAVIEGLSRCLAPGGWLIMGHAEDSRPARNWLEPVSGSIYRKARAD